MQSPGVAIDDADMPDWAKPYLSVDQLGLNRGLKWILLMYRSKRLEASRLSVAQRLHIATEGRDKKELTRRSHGGIAGELNIAAQTALDSFKDLEEQGWIVVERRPGLPSRYRLAWPVDDVLAALEAQEPPLCGETGKKGKRCSRRAGWGTPHQGSGRCKLHDSPPTGPPQRLGWSEAEPEAEPEPPPPQPLGTPELSTSPMVGADRPNGWGPPPQPLASPSPTVGDVYAVSTQGSLLIRRTPSVLAAGELTDRNARAAAKAPAAQPGTSPPPSRACPSADALDIVAAVPRYRHAQPWVRVRLAALIDVALDAGYGPDAIARYATDLAVEARYLDGQHIPELRAALARLARDRALGDACPDCGRPECACRPPDDPPWTAQDQAQLDAARARLNRERSAA